MSNLINVNGVYVSRDCKVEYGVNKKKVGKDSWGRYEIYMECKSIGEVLDSIKEFMSSEDVEVVKKRKFMLGELGIKLDSKKLVGDIKYDEDKGFLKLKEVVSMKDGGKVKR